MSEIAAIRTSLPIAHELRTLLQSYTPTYGFMLYILPYGAVLMSYSSSRNGTPESLRAHQIFDKVSQTTTYAHTATCEALHRTKTRSTCAKLSRPHA